MPWRISKHVFQDAGVVGCWFHYAQAYTMTDKPGNEMTYREVTLNETMEF